MELTNEEVGMRIKQAREDRGVSQDYVADAVCMAKSTISRYENGSIGKIKLPVIQSIADALNVDPAWIVGKSPSMYKKQDILTDEERELIRFYRSLNESGRAIALAQIKTLANMEEYSKSIESLDA